MFTMLTFIISGQNDGQRSICRPGRSKLRLDRPCMVSPSYNRTFCACTQIYTNKYKALYLIQ